MCTPSLFITACARTRATQWHVTMVRDGGVLKYIITADANNYYTAKKTFTVTVGNERFRSIVYLFFFFNFHPCNILSAIGRLRSRAALTGWSKRRRPVAWKPGRGSGGSCGGHEPGERWR